MRVALAEGMHPEGSPGVSNRHLQLAQTLLLGRRAEAGAFADLVEPDTFDFEVLPAPDRWVWVIILCDGCGPLSGNSTVVVLDYLDGTPYVAVNLRG